MKWKGGELVTKGEGENEEDRSKALWRGGDKIGDYRGPGGKRETEEWRQMEGGIQ